MFTHIRNLFAEMPEAKVRGYKAGRFSFNVKGGRCEHCSGDGIIKVEMNFLPDVFVPCEVCGGARYNHETLEVRYRGKNISEVLNMTVAEAIPFFENQQGILRYLKTLDDVGLGYISLGQPSTQLSGGEAQRIIIVKALSDTRRDAASRISSKILGSYGTCKSHNSKQSQYRNMSPDIMHVSLLDTVIDNACYDKRNSQFKTCFKKLKHRA